MNQAPLEAPLEAPRTAADNSALTVDGDEFPITRLIKTNAKFIVEIIAPKEHAAATAEWVTKQQWQADWANTGEGSRTTLELDYHGQKHALNYLALCWDGAVKVTSTLG